jgi:hypothetical protein
MLLFFSLPFVITILQLFLLSPQLPPMYLLYQPSIASGRAGASCISNPYSPPILQVRGPPHPPRVLLPKLEIRQLSSFCPPPHLLIGREMAGAILRAWGGGGHTHTVQPGAYPVGERTGAHLSSSCGGLHCARSWAG